jgi:methionine-gamma-lyase
MNTEKKFGFATRQIHAGHMENAAGSLCAPIYQTSTFAFSTVQQGGARFAGEEGGYIYTRLGNPTLGAVEEKLASLEGGEAAMAALHEAHDALEGYEEAIEADHNSVGSVKLV